MIISQLGVTRTALVFSTSIVYIAVVALLINRPIRRALSVNSYRPNFLGLSFEPFATPSVRADDTRPPVCSFPRHCLVDHNPWPSRSPDVLPTRCGVPRTYRSRVSVFRRHPLTVESAPSLIALFWYLIFSSTDQEFERQKQKRLVSSMVVATNLYYALRPLLWPIAVPTKLFCRLLPTCFHWSIRNGLDSWITARVYVEILC